MNFAEAQFWESLLLGLGVAWFVAVVVGKISHTARLKFEKTSFSLISMWLLFQESPLTLAAFLWVVLLGWVCLKSVTFERQNQSRSYLWMGLVVLQLAPLFYFKYWKFVVEGIFGLQVVTPHALIPMGLSFYSFQVIAVCLDSRRDTLTLPKFVDYFNFASFFPQIVAGPIERRKDLLPQIEKIRLAVTKESIEKALPWIILGLFYKMVLADNLAVLSGILVVDTQNVYHVIIEIVLFSLRIYFDFAGYSFVALGLGALFGVKLTLNFVSPYWSLGLRAFWRRWHVTLSQWLRDYVYFALGGSKKGIIWINLLITFLISGIWHGAGWNFCLWGVAHGVGLIFCHYSPKFKIPIFFNWLITMTFVFYTWLLFYETSVEQICNKTMLLLDIRNYFDFSMDSLMSLVDNRTVLALLAVMMVLSLVTLLMEGLSLKKSPYSYLLSVPAIFLMILCVIILAPVEPSTFIYFNF